MAPRIAIGKAPRDGGREPTLRDLLRVVQELRVEVHKRLDELTADLDKIRDSLHRTKPLRGKRNRYTDLLAFVAVLKLDPVDSMMYIRRAPLR